MNVLICDRCGQRFWHSGCAIRFDAKCDDYGGYYEKDICKDCKKSLKRWLKDGQRIAERNVKR